MDSCNRGNYYGFPGKNIQDPGSSKVNRQMVQDVVIKPVLVAFI